MNYKAMITIKVYEFASRLSKEPVMPERIKYALFLVIFSVLPMIPVIKRYHIFGFNDYMHMVLAPNENAFNLLTIENCSRVSRIFKVSILPFTFLDHGNR